MNAPTNTTQRCDSCGHELPIAKFKPKPREPGQRFTTCRDCTRNSKVIRCHDCGRPRRTKAPHSTKRCHRCALRRKLAATKRMAPRRCWVCDAKFLRMFAKDVECGIHHDFTEDRKTWAHGTCVACKTPDLPVWSVDTPICVRCLKEPRPKRRPQEPRLPSKRAQILALLERAHDADRSVAEHVEAERRAAEQAEAERRAESERRAAEQAERDEARRQEREAERRAAIEAIAEAERVKQEHRAAVVAEIEFESAFLDGEQEASG